MPKIRHVPERSCVACGSKLPKTQLIRVVRTTQGIIIVDTDGKEPGRGSYLCHLPVCWEKAIDKGALLRGFKQDIPRKDLEAVKAYFEQHIASHTSAP